MPQPAKHPNSWQHNTTQGTTKLEIHGYKKI